MTDKEKILAEIERRIKELGLSGSIWLARSELIELSDFINSLPEEPVSKLSAIKSENDKLNN